MLCLLECVEIHGEEGSASIIRDYQYLGGILYISYNLLVEMFNALCGTYHISCQSQIYQLCYLLCRFLPPNPIAGVIFLVIKLEGVTPAKNMDRSSKNLDILTKKYLELFRIW